MPVFRIFVEKKPNFAVEAKALLADIKSSLMLENLKSLRIINRYDAQKIFPNHFEQAIHTVFSEPAVDYIYTENPPLSENDKVFAVEFLPGQFDQRADSCAQCISLLTGCDRPLIRSAKVYILSGELTDFDVEKIKSYIINPVESREASLKMPETLDINYAVPTEVDDVDGFIYAKDEDLQNYLKKYGFAMDFEDIKFCQQYFAEIEKRNPTITEMRMIDTYWSDHCRHTTFSTIIEDAKIEADYIAETFENYVQTREELYPLKNKPMTLMDLAVIGAKKLKKDGILKDLDESEEINACSVEIDVDVDGNNERWLLMFKNETHNHPTEIEPFGGAATCLGGAIRDPLSGRSYVYQAMRVTGAANPLVPFSDTLKGKLPQKKIVTGAANGYSSYGNQIGLATGLVNEIYHSGYAAKRMEIGAVVGATPKDNVRREVPNSDDVVILLGGKTGRDGCGGATGSSKSHTASSLETCGAEVQKGNPPEERKIQRLFRNPDVTKMIKRCNDFGAGGVSVAIGELTDGLIINLDKVTKKYEGLDGTELAISESQERMAVVVNKNEAEKFIAEAEKENLEATLVAVVTDEPRLKMNWKGKEIVNLSREFLNSNGAKKHTNIVVNKPILIEKRPLENCVESWEAHLSNLNICSQKGLVERFDSTIGASTVLMPYGGKTQSTPIQAMAAKIPVLHGETTTCSLMSYGFNPFLSETSPYHGAIAAVTESLAKLVATGGSYKKTYLTFQEYFEKTNNNPSRWGKPFAALLGAYKAQLEYGTGAIGGKDSMSGTFENIDVPPTLVSFAVTTAKTPNVISPEFKFFGSNVVILKPDYDKNGLPIFESVRNIFEKVEKLISQKKAISAWAVSYGGVAEGLAKMAFGNRIGVKFTEELTAQELFKPCYGAFILEIPEGVETDEKIIGYTTPDFLIQTQNYKVDLDALFVAYNKKLEPVFPTQIKADNSKLHDYSYNSDKKLFPRTACAKPRVLIPVFPGTNCEYDTARAFEKAGAVPEIFVVKNLTAKAIEESVANFTKSIKNSQIIMIPGGFSGGDEPEGSAKFITAYFRNPYIKDAVHTLLDKQDGLMLGICNGFQALIKLGLVPFGQIIDMTEFSPTLTFNSIGRHQSMMVNTKISSNKSPWLYKTNVGDVHSVAISHGEGRFVAPPEIVEKLAQNGQIATQYVNVRNIPSLDIQHNPNTSIDAIEGITSPDGRIFGKMGHSERKGIDVAKNIPGNKDQLIFESGVAYFRN